MNDVASDSSPRADREHGWWRVGLATVLFLCAPAVPLLHIVLPVDQELVLIAPALAACAVVVAARPIERWDQRSLRRPQLPELCA